MLVVELGVYCVELGPPANSSIHTECVLGATEICVYGLRCTVLHLYYILLSLYELAVRFIE